MMNTNRQIDHMSSSSNSCLTWINSLLSFLVVIMKLFTEKKTNELNCKETASEIVH